MIKKKRKEELKIKALISKMLMLLAWLVHDKNHGRRINEDVHVNAWVCLQEMVIQTQESL